MKPRERIVPKWPEKPYEWNQASEWDGCESRPPAPVGRALEGPGGSAQGLLRRAPRAGALEAGGFFWSARTLQVGPRGSPAQVRPWDLE